MKKLLRACGLVVMSGAVLYLLSCDDNGAGPTPYAGPWKIVPCPDGASYLKAVFFLNPNLGYAVGSKYILKYRGTNWEVDYVYPAPSGKYSVGFDDVWFNATDDGWVCGSWYDIENNIQKGLILHYNGSAWTEVEHKTPSVWYEDVFFLDKDHGWAGGYGIARWDGNGWTYETDIGFITDMYFNSPTDGWAVSKYSERIYYYDGTSWTKVHEDAWGIELRSIFFTSPGHGWAGGMGVVSGTQSNILEYKNGEWRYYQGEPWNEGIRRDVNALHSSAADNGWAVGQTTFRWDGERWWYVKDPPDAGPIYDVFTISEDDAWAVGYVIMHYEP